MNYAGSSCSEQPESSDWHNEMVDITSTLSTTRLPPTFHECLSRQLPKISVTLTV